MHNTVKTTMFTSCKRQTGYLKVLSFLVLISMVVTVLLNSEQKKNTVNVQDKTKVGRLTLKHGHRPSQVVVNRGNKTKKRKSYVENAPSYNYEMDEIPQCPEKMKRRFPTALIAGVSKGGTSTLLRFLNVHPEIAARDGKEETSIFTSYFIKAKKENKSREWYRNLMPCSIPNQITIERSPAYFYAHRCPSSIFEFNSNMKLIFIFKEPAARAYSHYQMDKRVNKVKNQSFEEMVLLENLTQVNSSSHYMFVSQYKNHVKRWLRLFSRDQMLFLDGHAFISSPSDVLNSVENFLSIEHFFTKDMFKPVQNGKFCLSMEDVALQCPRSNKGLLYQSMKETTQTTLREYFKPLNKEFFKLIKKNFERGY